MGNAYILWIYEDAIRHATLNEDAKASYCKAVGEAVLKVCLEPDRELSPSGIKPVPYAGILQSNSNDVCLAGKQHSTWQQVYLWAGNCLTPLYDLTEERLRDAKCLVEDELKRRRHRSAEQDAPPNGGPATRLGNSAATEGPPSVN